MIPDVHGTAIGHDGRTVSGGAYDVSEAETVIWHFPVRAQIDREDVRDGIERQLEDADFPKRETGMECENEDTSPEVPTVSNSILAEADRVAGNDRSRDYGHPFDNHERIARLWNAYLDNHVHGPLRPGDVAMMMILLKIAREQNTPKRDNLVDIAGYAKCLDLIAERERVAQG